MSKNINETIEDWFQKSFHNTRLSADEGLMNQVIAAKENLKKLLTPAEIKKTSKEENK